MRIKCWISQYSRASHNQLLGAMSHWQGYSGENTYYLMVDSKPAEVIDPDNLDRIFCTAFVNTSSCFRGVRNADLPWFKQYKECESLEESISVVENLKAEILNDNFFNLYVWVLSSKLATIEKNGTNFLEGACREVRDLVIKGDYVFYKKHRYKLDKAKMLIWYNFCLCNMATYLVDRTVQWKQNRGVFHVDRLGDSDKRIFEFMRMLMEETSLKTLWRRCAEGHKVKPKYVGYEFPSHYDENGKIIPAQNSMQSSLVDWIVLATYAAKNGRENRDEILQQKLIELIQLLDEKKMLNGMEFRGNITWEHST